MSKRVIAGIMQLQRAFLKHYRLEMAYQSKFETRARAKLEIFDYIEVWYTKKRMHLALDYLTPVKVEKAMIKSRTEAAKNVYTLLLQFQLFNNVGTEGF